MADRSFITADPALDEGVRRYVAMTSLRGIIGHIEGVTSWGRRNSIWPMQFGLACCAIEMIASAASRFDISRFGAELFRPSPRQADLMIISGTVTKKMVPQIVRLYNQMPEPKYVISMGACANGGGPFKEGYSVVSGVDEYLPVDVYVRGCPPTPQALLHGLIALQKKIDGESYIGAWKRRKRDEIPVPLLGPDLVDQRQVSEIKEKLARGDAQRTKAMKEAPARRESVKAADLGSLDDSASAKAVGAKLADKFSGRVQAHAKNSLVVDRSVWLEVARELATAHGYNYLANLTSADYSDSYEVVYNLYKLGQDGQPALSVKVRADKDSPEVPSVVPVWLGADLQEREVFDLMGVRFMGHPNLKRIMMWDGFVGHPLRKDYLEAYYEEGKKSYATRWKEGHFEEAESRNLWGRNAIYPDNFDVATLKYPADPVIDEPVNDSDDRRMLVSIGPHHPSTHGVFQMRALLEGERIVKLEPVFGYLHRDHEKIGERNTYIMNMPYTDRLDYVSPMNNNLAYAIAVEKLTGMKVPERAEYIRVIMAELNRVMHHLWGIGFLINELGAWFTPMLYAIKERELILDLFEMVTGSRMMCNYMRFSGLAYDLPPEFLPTLRELVRNRLPKATEEMDNLLTKNDIVLARCQGVGVLTREQAINYSASGPVLRASGVKHDVRKAEPYSIYDRFEFDVPTFPNGDIYDRYRVRLAEVWQSLRILEQAMKQMPESGPIIEKNQYLLRVPAGEVYSRCENPKGELGFYIVSDGGMTPYRYHIRAPSFINLTALEEMCRGHLIADAVAILGSIDIVLGEVDR